jgi:hypothetical protein
MYCSLDALADEERNQLLDEVYCLVQMEMTAC